MCPQRDLNPRRRRERPRKIRPGSFEITTPTVNQDLAVFYFPICLKREIQHFYMDWKRIGEN